MNENKTPEGQNITPEAWLAQIKAHKAEHLKQVQINLDHELTRWRMLKHKHGKPAVNIKQKIDQFYGILHPDLNLETREANILWLLDQPTNIKE